LQHCRTKSNGENFSGPSLADLCQYHFFELEMSEVVRPEGWNDWKKPEAHSTARYAEFNSSGPGGNPKNRPVWSKQLSPSEAEKINVETVLGGEDHWNPLSIRD
jgi:pectinesterase